MILSLSEISTIGATFAEDVEAYAGFWGLPVDEAARAAYAAISALT